LDNFCNLYLKENYMTRILQGFLISSVMAGSAMAGGFSLGLENYIADKGLDENVSVILTMSEQANVAEMDRYFEEQQSPLAERHYQIVTALQETASRSQAKLLLELEGLRSSGKVFGWTSHWLTNCIVVNSSVQVLRDLASRSDVEIAEVNPEFELIEPFVTPVKPGTPHEEDSGIRVVEAGVQAVRATEVWSTLGIDGSGALVGVLDTGVDGTHAALSSRYRGNNGHPDSECWIDAAGLGDSTPVDQHYHGTHVMGTICGGAPGLEIGVAPGAEWIASNVINMGTGTAFDNAVISSLEFMADPDGNAGTIDDVPDVVQNSWGVNENFSGYVDCDTRWWSAIDNCEASGVCLTWSAGNEGSGSGTMRSPADRADSPYNCFSVGSTLESAPYDISSFSSRGPSGCGGAYTTKPEICAPGSDIYSAEPGGGYQNLSGTSMAGPHIAGVVALMRAANPNISVNTIKQVLIDTAIDKGVAGEDNTYGHGFVDAYEAVLAVMGGFGTVDGTVTDINTSLPISGVAVGNTAGPQTTNTNGSGNYSLNLAADTYTLSYEAFGYTSVNDVVVVSDGSTTINNIALSPAASALIYGYVFDEFGTAIIGASVSASGTPATPASTNGSGYYELTLPSGSSYDLVASKSGYGVDVATLYLGGSTQQDFVLPDVMLEDFESGNFAIYDWQMSGDAPWTIDSANPYAGLYCSKSGTITHNQASTMELTLDAFSAGDVSFWYSVSSESNYDYLQFYIDGSLQNEWSGSVAWTQGTYAVSAGTHTFTWTYAKDYSVDSGSDCGWVDDILFSFGPAEDNDSPVIAHTELSDTYDFAGAWSIVAAITDASGIANAELQYKIGAASWVNTPMSVVLADYSANIPGPTTPGTTIQYRIEATDASNNSNVALSPLYSFTILADITGPVITHTSLNDTSNGVGPWSAIADVSDAVSGIASVTLEYKVGAAAWQNAPMSTVLADYAGDIIGPASPGTLIQYKIVAIDNSSNNNQTTSQTYSFTILLPAGLEYCQDFENGFDDFSVETLDPSGNTWNITTDSEYPGQNQVAKIIYSAQNQVDHAILKSPVFDCSGQATVDMSFWHHLQMGYSGAVTDAYVRGSIDGGATWTELIAEWHAAGNPQVELEGIENYSLTSWAAGENNVMIMFEFYDIYDWWWNVDDVCLTGTLAPVELDPAVISIELTDVNEATVSWDAVNNADSYDVYTKNSLNDSWVLYTNTASTSLVMPIVAIQTVLFNVVARTDAALVTATPANPYRNMIETTVEFKK
jgi:subtilisin family serine protease